jgi:tetratricopeptide (TPR) repeat protein
MARYTEAVARRTPQTTTPDLQATLAERFSQTAKLLRDKQKLEQAERAYRQAISLREPLGKEAPPALRLAQSFDYNDLAFVLLPAKRLPDAERAVLAAIELKQALVGEFPENSDYPMHLAHSYLGFGYITSEERKTSDSVQAYGEAAGILNKLAAEKAGAEGLKAWLGHTWWELGDGWLRLDRVDDAEKAHQQGLRTFAALATEYPANTYYRQEQGFSLRRLADVAERAARTTDAERHLREALRFYRELAAETPASAFYRGEVAVTTRALAEVHARLGKWAEATDDLTEALKTSESGDQTELWGRLALVRLAMQDEPAYREACGRLIGQLPPNISSGNAAFRGAWSCVLLPDAGVDAAKVVRLAEQAMAANAKDPDYLLVSGAALYRAGRFEEAANTLADAEAAYRREKSAPTPGINVSTTVVYSQLFLAMTHQRLGHHEEAVQWLKKAIEESDPVPSTRPSSAKPAWNRRVALQILRKEAERLITQPAR